MDDCYYTKEENAIKLSSGRLVCPCCKDHAQYYSAIRGKDCKNLFIAKLKGETEYIVVGQCNCWSDEHG